MEIYGTTTAATAREMGDAVSRVDAGALALPFLLLFLVLQQLIGCMEQENCRTSFLDSYFALTANLGAHTFFMIMLPMLFWFGFTDLGRG